MSKLFTATVFAVTLLSAGIASATPNSGKSGFDASKFFAGQQLSGN